MRTREKDSSSERLSNTIGVKVDMIYDLTFSFFGRASSSSAYVSLPEPLRPECEVVGGSDGAIDPKTFRKWVWAFIFAISYLEEEVVSFVCLLLLI
jgi:hypothetical protein